MQKDTGELLSTKEVQKLINSGKKLTDDFVETGVKVGDNIKVGNIDCTVRKITHKDFILRPIKIIG